MNEPKRRDSRGTRERLLRAAEYLFLRGGYAATTVDEICARAGATKGAFFHHFRNKQELGIECGRDHAERFMAFLDMGARRRPDEPVGRLFDYLDHFVEQATAAEMPACLIGVLTLELAAVNDEFRALCKESLDVWSGTLERLLTDALSQTGRDADAHALSTHFLSTIQGSMLLAKANGNPAVIAESVGQLRHHFEHVVGARA